MSGLRQRQQSSALPSGFITLALQNSQAAPSPTTTFPSNLGETGASPTDLASPNATSTPEKSKVVNSRVIVILVACLAATLGLILAWYILRRTRAHHKNAKYFPTTFLKKLWEKWEPEPIHHRLSEQNDHLEPHRTADRATISPPVFDITAAGRNTTAATTTVGVDRNTSVRSVMTLPAYHPSARESEQVLGREGERGGIDVVIEFPEGADDEEERREAEMEALYQVRVARRRENEEREERRRLRREARERGDMVALRELQAQARAPSATGGRTVEELRAEHDRMKKERQRAVSSVSYADLGVARHDGTRLRANSNDSEREGLLGDAASIAASSRHHRRDRSASSVISIDTMHSDLPSPGLTRSRGNSRASRLGSPPRRASGQSQISRANSPSPPNEGSSPEMIEHEDFPPNSPPGYENISLATPLDSLRQEPPPDYSSPVLARGEHRTRMFDSPRASTVETRRTSTPHVGQLISGRRTSSSSSLGLPSGERRLGGSGAPQLPSLRLSVLPSIQVNSPSPTPINEDEEHHPTSHV